MTIDEAENLPEYAKVTFKGKVYDYGYVSQTGHLVLYEEGERNMQDSIAVEPEGVVVVPERVIPALAPEVEIEAFDGVDLRVGRITACEPLEGADKLLKLRVDLGPLGERTILSGLRKSYQPQQLVGKHVAVFANLAPRKMRGILSQGMVLAAGDAEDALTVVELDAASRPGDKVS
jgi:methionine--tRNA ligase beta chain